MTSSASPGVAYDFWRRMKTEQAKRGWTDDQLSEKSGLPRSTFTKLKTNTRTPTARVINTLADALGIDREEAHELAGIVPRTHLTARAISVRDAILASPDYDEAQRDTLLRVLEMLDRANQLREQAARLEQQAAGERRQAG